MVPSYSDSTPAAVLSVVSGKGGVGKSVVAVHLAEALVQAGLRVALVDADVGQSTCPLLLGEKPRSTVLDVVYGQAHLDEALHPTTGRVMLVQGARGPSAESGEGGALWSSLDALLDRIRPAFDVVIIDAPSGLGAGVRWALRRASRALLVLTPEEVSLANAYMLAVLAEQLRPGLHLDVLVNEADLESEAEDAALSFCEVAARTTDVPPSYAGWVPYSAALRRAVRQATPAGREAGAVQRAFGALAATLAERAVPHLR